jgi:hypothetical protein
VTDAVQNLVAALASGQVEVVDLTQPLSEETPILRLPEPFANTPRFRLRELSHYDERGPAWYWNAFEGGEHTGTHLDAPIHWVTGQEQDDVSQIPPARLIGPAVVIDHADRAAADPDHLLTVEDVEAFEASHGPLPDGGCTAPAGTPGPTTRPPSSTPMTPAPTPPASTSPAPAGWPTAPSWASVSRPWAPTPAPPTASTPPSPATPSCSARASTASPSWPTSTACPRPAPW